MAKGGGGETDDRQKPKTGSPGRVSDHVALSQPIIDRSKLFEGAYADRSLVTIWIWAPDEWQPHRYAATITVKHYRKLYRGVTCSQAPTSSLADEEENNEKHLRHRVRTPGVRVAYLEKP